MREDHRAEDGDHGDDECEDEDRLADPPEELSEAAELVA
jgi:hypothetical protein